MKVTTISEFRISDGIALKFKYSGRKKKSMFKAHLPTYGQSKECQKRGFKIGSHNYTHATVFGYHRTLAVLEAYRPSEKMRFTEGLCPGLRNLLESVVHLWGISALGYKLKDACGKSEDEVWVLPRASIKSRLILRADRVPCSFPQTLKAP